MPHPVVPLRLEGLRVLLVEDNALSRKVLFELLQAAGVIVDLAGDGSEAIQYLLDERRCYDAILMDLQLPTLDGFAATRAIRADPCCTVLPIIAMTAHTLPEVHDHCLTVGMNDCLAKPFSISELLHTLARWTGRRVMPDRTPVVTERAATSPPMLPGLELEAALQRLGGDNRLLCELLERVAEDYGEVATVIRAALSRKDLVLAQRLAHTVRGVAGSIGATAVQAAAATLEQHLRVGDMPEETLVQALAKSLGQTLASIALVRRAWTPSPHLDSPVRPELKRGLRELRVRLERQALSAIDLFQSLRQSLLESQPGLPVEPLGRYIEQLDFKTAGRLLRELASRMGISLQEE